MSPFDLTTLANVKAWLGLPSPPTLSDVTLSNLVTAASRAIYAAISRPALLPQTYNETIDLESDRTYLRNWPVLQVSSVTLDGLVLPPASLTSNEPALGYLLQPGDTAPPGRPQAIDLFGRRYHRRRQRLDVIYEAGYAIQSETWTAPAAAPFTVTASAPFGPWASDLGVVYASSELALQAMKAAASAGRYSVTNGIYAFNSSDAGATLAISYGFIPQDLAQAATELAAERFRAADRIGLRSKSVGGQETIAYDVSGVSASVEALIAPYKRTAF
jgi:hypothetical protein